MRTIARWARACGSFWWDFLVGDTPELLLATVAIVVAALLLGRYHIAGYLLLPALAIVCLVASAYRGRRQTHEPPPVREEYSRDRP
jgi:hypothetical protein